MTKLQNAILQTADTYIIELCNLLGIEDIEIKAIKHNVKTFLIELSNGNLIEARSFQDACNQIECLIN